MSQTFKKIGSVFFAVLALIGIGSVNAKAATNNPHPTEKAPLYLEHSEVYHWTEGGTHWSHGSHASHSSHYSGR